MSKNLKILLACPIKDNQSGIYIHDSLIQEGHQVAIFDWKEIFKKGGQELVNKQLIEAHKELKPDLTIIIKGLSISGKTIREIKEFHKNPIAAWIFDVTLGGTYTKDVAPYIDFIKECDTFYTMDNSAVSELKELGVNAKWLTEGCYMKAHNEIVINSIQKRKYGADVVFLGSVGMIHPNRSEVLKKIWEEGFDLKIYGEVYFPEGEEPKWVKDCHTGFAAINDKHSQMVQSSKVVIGIDGWPHRSKSMSARVYRTLCPGGFLLTNHTKDIEDMFEVGKELDTFEDDLIDKLVYWLSHDKERQEVAKNGQKRVIADYQFKNSLSKIVEDIDG